MQPNQVFALLTDAAGSMLLARRRGSILWSIPGGDARPGVPLDELLATYCQRQIGAMPDFVLPFTEFTLAGGRIAVGFAEIAHARAGARGRTEAVVWIRPEAVPAETDPVARMAVALKRAQVGPVAPGGIVRPPGQSYGSLGSRPAAERRI